MDPEKLEKLTDPQRACLRIYCTSPNYKAVANALNISIDAVKDRLERARRTLGVTDSFTAAYALAVAEGRATPPAEGWPPSQGLTPPANFPPDMPLPKPKVPVVAEVRDNLAAAPLLAFDTTSLREKSNDEHLSDQLPSLASRVLRSAEVVALVVTLAWIAMAAINSLRPGFFRFLDNLHS